MWHGNGQKWSEVNYKDGMNTDVVKYWNSKGELIRAWRRNSKGELVDSLEETF